MEKAILTNLYEDPQSPSAHGEKQKSVKLVRILRISLGSVGVEERNSRIRKGSLPMDGQASDRL